MTDDEEVPVLFKRCVCNGIKVHKLFRIDLGPLLFNPDLTILPDQRVDSIFIFLYKFNRYLMIDPQDFRYRVILEG